MIKPSGINFDYNYKGLEGVQDFNKELFPNHFLCLICGKPGSGKTSLLKFLLMDPNLFFKRFDYVFIISPSYKEYECLFLPDENFYKELSFDWINQKLSLLQNTKTYVNVLFILDDVIADLFKNRQAKPILDFIFNRRHILKNGMISIILTSQKYTFVPTCIRSNISILFTFRLNNMDFINIRKELVFNDETFVKAIDMIFQSEQDEDKAKKSFMYYRIDNDTYFKNFDKIIFNNSLNYDHYLNLDRVLDNEINKNLNI